MNDIKKEAMEIVNSFYDFVSVDYRPNEDLIKHCQKQCALKSIERTIGVLEDLRLYFPGRIIERKVNHQRELLKAVNNL